MPNDKDIANLLIRCILIPVCILCAVVLLADSQLKLTYLPKYTEDSGKLTVRINTYKRLDLLEYFVDYYKSCPVLEEIQVVWSDQENKPPYEWKDKYPILMFEEHSVNSLNNRFRPLQEIRTEAVLSIDDDLIIPCDDLKEALRVWTSNKAALVGFSARMSGHDTATGAARYFNWQYTWWSGVYSIVLTKASILHRNYLADFDKAVGVDMLKHIDDNRNCEDLAMSHVIALKSRAAPVWMQITIFEVSTEGISSGSSHFIDRSKCLDMLRSTSNVNNAWIIGLQKVVALNWFDAVKGLFHSDYKN